MSLAAGFTMPDEASVGGIKSAIDLCYSSDIASFSLDGEDYDAVTMQAGKTFVRMECDLGGFNPLKASGANAGGYDIKITPEIHVVTPELITFLKNCNKAAGLTAIVHDNNGRSWVVGWIGTDFADGAISDRMKMPENNMDYTNDKLQIASSKITFECKASEPPRAFTGTVPLV